MGSASTSIVSDPSRVVAPVPQVIALGSRLAALELTDSSMLPSCFTSVGVSESELAMAHRSTNIMARLFQWLQRAARYYDSLDPSSPRAAPQPLPHPPAPVPQPAPSCGVFAACCMLLSCSIVSFAYVSAHAPRGTETTLHLAKPGCTWWPRPLDCLDLRFKSVAVDAPSPPPPLSRGACTGPLVAHLYHMHRGDDAIVDLAEAHALSSTIRQHTDQSSLCGTAASVGAKPHACFAASTATGRLERAKIGRFIGCLVEHEPAGCRAELCS